MRPLRTLLHACAAGAVYANGGSLYVVRATFTTLPARIARDWFASVRFRGTDLQLYLGNTVWTAAY